MTTLITVTVYGFDKTETIHNIAMFRAEDASGSFAIMPGHDYFMTMLDYGMAVLRHDNGATSYLALPGGFLHITNNELNVHCRQFWQGDEYAAMSATLRDHVTHTEQSLHKNKSNLERIEQSMIKHMLDMERQQ